MATSSADHGPVGGGGEGEGGGGEGKGGGGEGDGGGGEGDMTVVQWDTNKQLKIYR